MINVSAGGNLPLRLHRGVNLALHLGAVFALFLTMLYGKFVHGLDRFGALALMRQNANWTGR